MIAAAWARLRAWQERQRDARRDAIYDAGWEWAAGKLLANQNPLLQSGTHFDALDDEVRCFDDGVADAVTRWCSLGLRVPA